MSCGISASKKSFFVFKVKRKKKWKKTDTGMSENYVVKVLKKVFMKISRRDRFKYLASFPFHWQFSTYTQHDRYGFHS